jgi:hypothetical protein
LRFPITPPRRCLAHWPVPRRPSISIRTIRRGAGAVKSLSARHRSPNGTSVPSDVVAQSRGHCGRLQGADNVLAKAGGWHHRPPSPLLDLGAPPHSIPQVDHLDLGLTVRIENVVLVDDELHRLVQACRRCRRPRCKSRSGPASRPPAPQLRSGGGPSALQRTRSSRSGLTGPPSQGTARKRRDYFTSKSGK